MAGGHMQTLLPALVTNTDWIEPATFPEGEGLFPANLAQGLNLGGQHTLFRAPRQP